MLDQVSYSFDVSVISLYIFLALGKTLFSITKDMVIEPKILFKAFKLSEISVFISTPKFLEICLSDSKFDSSNLKNLKKFILAGEVLTKSLVLKVFKRFKNSKVINGYGPTECTVLLSACEITNNMIESNLSIPIGKIPKSCKYKILEGELIVISESVSDGYFRDPQKTKEVFFRTKDGKMGYKTGDIVFEKNKLLYFVSRKDDQIKLNGFRIELFDIQNNLNKIDFIKDNVVLPFVKEKEVKFLSAFVVLKDCSEKNLSTIIKIKKELGKKIPSYMIPKKIVILDKFLININGKIDKNALMGEIQ